MTSVPAFAVTVATALAASPHLLVASPPPPPTPPPATATPASSPAGTPRPSPVEPGATLLVGWETHEDAANLLVLREGGAVERQPLPAVPNEQVAAGLRGGLVFLAGPAAQPVAWVAAGDAWAPRWSSRALVPTEPQEERLMWPCVGPGATSRLAVQSNDTGVHLVEDDGRLRRLPSGLLQLRPGGCAWIGGEHLIVAVDTAHPVAHIGFAALAADGSGSSLLGGPGGEQPAASAVSLAAVVHGDGAHYSLVVGPLPATAGEVPSPTLELPASAEWAYLRPALSADGRRLAIVEVDPSGRPARLLLYDLEGEPTLLAEVDVRGARGAGPAWVADPA